MKKLFTILFCLMFGFGAIAQQKIQLRSADRAECTKSDMTSLKASFSFSTIEAEEIATKGGDFSWISMPNTVLGGNVGEPQLPVINQLIAVPFGAEPTITVTSYSTQEYSLKDLGVKTIVPRQAPVRKNQDLEDAPFVMNEAAYQSTRGFKGEPTATVSVEGTMRGINLGTMTIEPMSYDPVNNVIRVFNNIEVEVNFNGADVMATKDMLLKTYSPAFEPVYAQLFNGRAVADAYTDHPDIYHTPVKMLVICYSGFEGNEALNNWLQWKLQKGYYVDIYYTGSGSNNAGTTSSAIASFIKTKYNASVSAGNAYTYLIVIGDTGQVPQYMTKTIDSDIGQCASDLGYSSVNFSSSTSNYFPDMYYSRISVENTTQLTSYINKVLTYERYEFADGGNYLNNVLLVGGWDSSWTSRVAKPTINYGKAYYFNTSNTTYGGFGSGTINAVVSTSSSQGYSGTNNGVYNGINNGACLVNYTAHGDKQEWQVPQFTAAQAATLTNTGKYFFCIGNCCLTGNFNNTTTSYSPGSTIGTTASFGETMMRVPNAGAIAYIGCSPYSYWYEDFYWAVGAHSYSQGNYPTTSASSTGVYDAMFNDANWNSASALLYLGNLAVQQAVTNGNTNSSVTDGNCNNSAHYYFQFYHTFGDGSIMPYITKPETNTVTIPSIVTPGTSSITVNALAGSYVAVTDNSSVIYGVAEANSNGVATVNFTNAIPTSGTLYVVVTRQQYQPYTGTIEIVGGTKYNITASANPTAGGSVSGAGEYYENTSCTLTATANAHYEFSRWTKNGSQVSTANPYTFTVSGNGDYVAQFTALSPHTVTCSAAQNGTISASPTTAYKGEEVTLSATPASGYYLGVWTVKDANNNDITVNENKFTMPDSDVTVSATFVTGYNVTLASVMNGTISANPTAGPAGTEVTLTATPATGYVFDSWLVYNSNNVSQTVTVSNNKFTLPSYDVTVVGFFGAQAGGDVTVGSGTSTSQYLPTYVWYNYCLSQQIYTASEINGSGTITAISFYWYGQSGSATSSGARNLKIYMSHTNNTNLTNAWIQETNSHLVYDGTQTFNAIGWHTITLDTPFQYNGTSNLVITVDDNTGGYTVSAKHYFRTYSTNENRARVMCNDDTNPDPLGTVSTTISSSDPYNLLLTSNAQIKFSITSAASSVSLSASPTSLQGFTYPEGNGPSAYQTVALVGANLDANVTVSAPADYEVCLTENGTYASSLSIAPTSGNVQKMVYVRLKAGLAQGNYNNESLTFTSGSATQTVTLSGTVSQGDGTYYAITVAAEPEVGGTVTGGNTYKEGTTATLTATANAGYTFQNWTLNGDEVSTNATYSFEVVAAGNYIANFTRNSYTITVTQASHGTISADKDIAYTGDIVTLTEDPDNGYYFSGWEVYTANNQAVEVSNDNTFVMPDSNVTVTASFAQGFVITLANTPNGTVTANKENALPGETITLTTTPDTDYFLSTLLVLQSGDVDNSVTVTNNQFTMPSFDVTVFAIFKANEIEEVTVGSGTNTNSNIPTYVYYNYSLSQQIYTASEIGSAGNITAIAFKVSNSKSASRTLDVYMKATTATAFTSTTGWTTCTSSDKVFSGSVTFASSGWTTITFNTPFEYDGTSNVIITVDDNTGSYVSSSSNSPQFYVYSTGANRALRYYNDNTNLNPTSSISTAGTYVTSNNQITFTVSHPSSGATLSVSPNSISNFSYEVGDGPSRKKALDIIGIDVAEDIVVTAPNDFEISDVADGTYGSTVTISASSRGNRETVTYDFEDGWQGWTTFQGTTTSPHSWMHNTEYIAYDSNGDQIIPECHDSSSGMMLSESYISAASSGGSGTAVTPDNYLVSPQIELGGSFSFYAASRMSNYPAEKFTVYVSQTGNTSASNFTTDLLTVTLSNNSWNEYTVDLSAYSGMGYVAIRHYDCTDQHLLYIDDVTITSGGTTHVNPTNPTTDLLTANVYVRLKANLAEGSYDGTLTVATGEVTSNVSLSGQVTENTSGTVTQTVEMSSGTNWWTAYVEFTLEQLETALGDNGLMISAQDGSSVTYDETFGWGGDLSEIEVGKMYIVQTKNNCTFDIEGTAIDPNNYTISLTHGNNWIGFNGNQATEINAALANLNATADDVITSQDGLSASYDATFGWGGDLTTLQPGQAYIYTSNATGNVEFKFASPRAGDTEFTKDQEFHWPGFEYHDFMYHMDIRGKAYFDGVLQDDRPNIEVACFVGDELRGTKYLVEAYPSALPGVYFIWNACYYDVLGETFTFKAYDHDNNIEYDLCDVELIGTSTAQGTPSNPIAFHFTKSPSFGPDYPWNPSTAYSGDGMLVLAQVKIDGELVTRDTYEVGAFCGDECRANSNGGEGSNLDDWTDVNLGYFAWLTIKGNDGDVISFYLYDKESNSVVHAGCPTTIELENDGELGLDPENGDLFVLNFITSPFFTKDIDGYSGDGGWYLIASPIGQVAPTDVEGMTDNVFDLYRFNQSADLEWENYKDNSGSHYHFDLEPGRGYLYANNVDTRLVFVGNPYDEDELEVPLVYDEDAALPGWNLIGNPYSTPVTIDKSFYVMNDDGSEIVASEVSTVNQMEGIFVKAATTGQSVTFAPSATKDISNDAWLSLNLSFDGGNTLDRVIVRFDERELLQKLTISANSALIYVPQQDGDYAMVNGLETSLIPVNFKANRTGSYTLSANIQSEGVEYLHLFDQITGEDVDMLLEDSYTFMAAPSDRRDRFVLHLRYNGFDSVDDIFVYQNGSDIVVCAEGTLEIFDVMGRYVGTREIHGVESIPALTTGVYIFRMIGEDIRTQKIIVR